MTELTKAQDLVLQLIEHASANRLDGARLAADLRANQEMWRAAFLTRLVRPVHQKLENPFNRTTSPASQASLLNRVDLLVMRDLPRNFVNLDTLFIQVEPGKQSQLGQLAARWNASETEWYGRREAMKAMGTSVATFKDYDPEEDPLLRVWWD